MGFNTALSGLMAAATDLQVTGNNIANANTTGFKESRAEFADLYASSLVGVNTLQTVAGVRVTEIAQQFNQGNVETTSNSLDLAVTGEGFFALGDNVGSALPSTYTRNGAFQLNQDGYVVTDQGAFLMGYQPNGTATSEGFNENLFTPLLIDTSQGAPIATSQAKFEINLDSREPIPSVGVFDPANSESFNSLTSVTMFDSQGNSHIARTYFVKTGANTWDSFLFVDDTGVSAGAVTAGIVGTPAAAGDASVTPIPSAVSLVFSPSGQLEQVNGRAITDTAGFGATVQFNNIDMTTIDPSTVVEPMSFSLNFADSTQLGAVFSVNDLSQNGLPTGNLTGIDVDGAGVVLARYSNGGSQPIGQVALARFTSQQSLAKAGDTNWKETIESGAVIFGKAGANNFGELQSSALENSNVELSEQLVHLIVAQQAYQANAKTITTEQTIMQTILNV